MSKRLYLIESRARDPFVCQACRRSFPRGVLRFRHDPYPAARLFRGEKVTHWCRECVLASPDLEEQVRYTSVPVVAMPSEVHRAASNLPLFDLLRVELIRFDPLVLSQLVQDPQALHRLDANQFENLVCDRLNAMGFEPQRTGLTNRKDGGIDIVFWPRRPSPFPFLGAAQIKHHRSPSNSEGPATVREFAGAIASLPINMALLVTNTSFSPDAQWFARERAKLVRLREFEDVRRWLAGNFDDDAEWREIPAVLELCPGVVVRIR